MVVKSSSVESPVVVRVAKLLDVAVAESSVPDAETPPITQGMEPSVTTVTLMSRLAYYEEVSPGTVDVVDGIPVHRLAIPLPRDLPVNPLAPLQLRSQLRRFDVAHIHMGVVSPFATDAAVLTSLLKIPTVMTWHCVLDKAAYAVRFLRSSQVSFGFAIVNLLPAERRAVTRSETILRPAESKVKFGFPRRLPW